MQKQFVQNLFFVLFLNLLIKPFWIIGIDVAVQNRVGAEEYGLYYPIFGFSILLNILLDFGITNYNSKNIAQHSHMLGRYFSGIFNVKVILGLLYFIATLGLGYVIGYRSEEIFLLAVLAVNQFLSSLILYLRSNIAGLLLFKTDGIISILDRLIMIAICSILLWGSVLEKPFRIQWFVYAQFWAYLITAIITFLVVFKKAKFYKISFDTKMFRIILKESLPFALLVLLMSFYYRLDSVMVERLLDDGKFQAGVYAQSYRLLEGFNMFGYLFAGLLLPIFARMIKEKLAINQLVKTAFNLLFIPSVALSIVSFFYSEEIMNLLYVENIQQSAKIFAVLMFSFVAIALTYVYGTLLTANGNLKALNILSLLGLLINFSLNYMLIPKYGAFGAAFATLITQLLVILSQILLVKRVFDIPYEAIFIAKNLLVLILGIGAAYLIFTQLTNWVFASLLMIISMGFLSFIFGLLNIRGITQLLKSTKSD